MSRLSKESSSLSIASTSQEGREEGTPSLSSQRTLRVTLLSSEWRSTKGGLSTINRELAIQLAKHPNVEVSVYLPQCSEEDKRDAASHSVDLIEAEEMPGYGPVDWLATIPKDHVMDCVIGHGVHLGKQVQLIKHQRHCKWIQVVHTAPEELGMYKSYADAISKGEKKHQVEVKLCELADQVVAVGPKLADAFSGYLRPCGKDQNVLNLTPSIFSEFADVKQATDERTTFSVLVFGRGDTEDFQLKGYDIAAKAIAELKNMPYKLVFVGAPSGKEKKVAEMLLQQGIAPNQLTVRCFKESREQLAKLFCEVDLAIMPSRTEGFGLAALEALSAGLPVLVSGNSGFGEALKNVPYGSNCVVHSEDPKDWAKAIKTVRQKDRKLRLKESKLLCEEYAKAYNWQGQCGFLVEGMMKITSESGLFADGCPSSVQAGLDHELHTNQTSHTDSQALAFAVEILKSEYNKRSLLKPLLWENTIKLPIEDVYTRLRIVSRRKTDFKLESREVDMYDIFKDPKDVIVLVEGSPGIGKTTFCLKIAHDWANEKIPKDSSFPEFEVVLLLKCRDIDGDILEIIDDQLLPEDMDEKIKKELRDHIKDFRHQRKVLIILDGLDETPVNSEDIVDKLLHKKIFRFCHVLATSRQERGIVVRQKVDFDILLQIEGFTEADAFEYIRKHFSHFGPEHLSKGERLIQAIQENSFLHELPSNPLNLLLLCIVFEEFDGKLPSARTKLYEIIVQCLLKRFCAKEELEVPKDDKDLMKQFEESLLALGELAWICLLEDRLSFQEGELERVERVYQNLVARKLGLIFKEASVKRLKPQHEYHFFHKTFQEYLAAWYLALKLLREEINVFDDFKLNFCNHVAVKYRQVFLFVSGILGNEAGILFRQIGERLQSGDWDWLECREEEATFFTESFSESGNGEQVAVTLCSFIPFPLTINMNSGVFLVVDACRSYSRLQHPVHLKVTYTDLLEDVFLNRVVDYLASCIQLETFSFYAPYYRIASRHATALLGSLAENLTLSSFILRPTYSIPADVAVAIGNGLATSKTLATVSFQLINEWGEAWASALEIGLSADAPLNTVFLTLCGSMSDVAIQALNKVLSNAFLTSLVLIVNGEIQDSLATAIGEGLTSQTMLKSLTLIVYGKLSQSGIISLERGLLENGSLDSLDVRVFGEPPGIWATVVENLLSAKMSMSTLIIHPNTKGNITDTKVARLCPPLPKNNVRFERTLTVNLWGTLSCNGVEALEKFLRYSSPSRFTLNIHGRVTEHVANRLTSYLEPHTTLSFITVNIWGELTRDGNTAFEGQSSSSHSHHCHLNVHPVMSEYFPRSLDFCIDDHSSLTSVFAKVMETRTSKLRLTVSGISEVSANSLVDGLANSVSLTTLALTVNNYTGMNENWMQSLGDGLANNTSLTTLDLTINNHSDMSGDRMQYDRSRDGMQGLRDRSGDRMQGLDGRSEDWLQDLGDGNWMQGFSDESGDWMLGLGDRIGDLVQGLDERNVDWMQDLDDGREDCMQGLGDQSGDWMQGLDVGLTKNTSLTALTLTINNYHDMSGSSMQLLGNGLAKNTSLTTLTIAVNNYSYRIGDWMQGLLDGLAINTSLTTLNLTMNNYRDITEDRMQGLGDGLAKNKSLTSLTVAVNNYSYRMGGWMPCLGNSLAKNTSLTTLTLAINSYSNIGAIWMRDLGDGLAQNTLLTTLTLTVSNYKDDRGVCMTSLCDGLAKNTSLTSLTLTVNYCSDIHGTWMLRLGRGLAKNTSLTGFSLTVNNYSDVVLHGLGDGLAKNTSLTTLAVTINNYSDMCGFLVGDLVKGLAKNKSITSVTLTFNNFGSGMIALWLEGLGDRLAQSESLTTLTLTINSCSEVDEDCLLELCDSLAKSETLTTLQLIINDHSDTSRGLGFDLSQRFQDCKSLTLLGLTGNLHGEANVR